MSFLGLCAILLVVSIIIGIFTMPLVIYVVIEKVCKIVKSKTSTAKPSVSVKAFN